jgi:PPOX class probable F420-dependent enzyme
VPWWTARSAWPRETASAQVGAGSVRPVGNVDRPDAWMVDLVQAARVARLATHEPDGRIHIVPCCYALTTPAERPAVLYTAVDGKPKRSLALRRLANVAADPDVALVVDHYDDDDWDALAWVRLRGTARLVDDEAERSRAVALLVERYRQYRAAPPAGAVLAVEVDAWQGWRSDPGRSPGPGG